MRLLLDSMLGKLCTWLRVTGYDSHYKGRYRYGEIEALIKKDDRILLTRKRNFALDSGRWIFISHEKTGDQLLELGKKLGLDFNPARWFTRCLRCNTPLRKASPTESRGNVPDYIYQQYVSDICFCPTCHRFFWPGSHRYNMIRQLEEWGIGKNIV